MATYKEMKTSFGGLKIGNSNAINTIFLCDLCKLLQLHSMQLVCCGTRLCRWCSYKGLPDSEPFICPFCHTKQSKKEMFADRGVERELNTTTVECHACTWNGLYKDYLEHLQQCHMHLECSDCHSRFFAVNAYEEHRHEICEYRSIPCELPGCDELIKWSDIEAHYLMEKHQKLLVEFIIQHIKNNGSREIKPIQKGVDMLSPGLTTLLDNSRGLKSQHDQIKANCERSITEINETKKIFNGDNEKFLKCIQPQNEMDKELEDTNKLYASTKMLILDVNGSMIFSFHRHSEDIDSSFSIYSPTFKTSPFGYLFILRVCSTIESTYLSIYITLLRSDFDPILFYPFPYNISLCLYDQSGQEKHITSTIEHDPNSSSLARPTSEKNNEFGITEFCPLNYLSDRNSLYLKDGVFFIRISFDFMNTGFNPV